MLSLAWICPGSTYSSSRTPKPCRFGGVTCGPPVSAPQRQGFGVRLLEYVLPGQIQAKATIEYKPEGVQMHCSVPMPLDGHR